MTKLSDSKQTAFTIAHEKLTKTGILFRKISELRVADLQKAMNDASSSYYTARDIKTLFSHMYKRAMIDQDARDNLALVLTLPELVEAEATPFSAEEQKSLWSIYADGNTFAGYILLMIYTGMMPGELLKTTRDQIDWDAGEIVGAGLKTNVRRKAPIVYPPLIDPVLRSLCEYSTGSKLVTLNKDKFYELYYATLEQAKTRRLKPYSCRHTTGTALARENLPIAVVQKTMRHAKYQSTQRYIHMDTDDVRDAVTAISERINPAKESGQQCSIVTPQVTP